MTIARSAADAPKAAARRLAEAGCSVSEIAAITGHRTLKEVSRYTQAADQKTMAKAAIGKIGGTQGEHNSSNLENRLDKSGAKHLPALNNFRKLADGVGFEPTVGLHPRRFSRPLP